MPDNIARYYVLVRTDLPIWVQLVQVGHACITAGAKFGCPEYHHLVLCGVPSETDLNEAAITIAAEGIGCCVFYEPDDGIGHTALCTAPVTDPLQRRFFRRFPLWPA